MRCIEKNYVTSEKKKRKKRKGVTIVQTTIKSSQ